MAVLEVPLSDNVFPPVTLTDAQLATYEKQSRDKVNQLIRIAEDADCVYKWAEIISKSGNSCFKARVVTSAPVPSESLPSPPLAPPKIHATDILLSNRGDSSCMQAPTKSQILLKSSVLLRASSDDVMDAIARISTTTMRKSSQFLYPSTFIDSRTLFHLPPIDSKELSSRTEFSLSWGPPSGKGRRPRSKRERSTHTSSTNYSFERYHAIKWQLFGQHRIYKRRNLASIKHIKLSNQQCRTIGKTSAVTITPHQTTNSHALHIETPCPSNLGTNQFMYLRRSLLTPRDHLRQGNLAAPLPAKRMMMPFRTVLPDTAVDFCVLEHAGNYTEFCSELDTGTRRNQHSSNVLAFFLQYSIDLNPQISSLEAFGIARGKVSLFGIVVAKTSRQNVVSVTAICQLDTDANASPMIMKQVEQIMIENVGHITRLERLLERQRMSRLEFVEQWQWIPNADRKVCAVCLRNFFLHRKHHCRACGEVVCSFCAPLRELEHPIADITSIRVCSLCLSGLNKTAHRSSSSAKSLRGHGRNTDIINVRTSSRKMRDGGQHADADRCGEKTKSNESAAKTENEKSQDYNDLCLSSSGDSKNMMTIQWGIEQKRRGTHINSKSIKECTSPRLGAPVIVETLREERDNLFDDKFSCFLPPKLIDEKALNNVASQIDQVRKAMHQTILNQDGDADSETAGDSSSVFADHQIVKECQERSKHLMDTLGSVFYKQEELDGSDSEIMSNLEDSSSDHERSKHVLSAKSQNKTRVRRKRKLGHPKSSLDGKEANLAVDSPSFGVVEVNSQINASHNLLTHNNGSQDTPTNTATTICAQQLYDKRMIAKIQTELSEVCLQNDTTCGCSRTLDDYHRPPHLERKTALNSHDIEKLEEKIVGLQRSLLLAHERLKQIDVDMEVDNEKKDLQHRPHHPPNQKSASRQCHDITSGYQSGYTSGYSSEHTSDRSSLNDSQTGSSLGMREYFMAIDEDGNVDGEFIFEEQQRQRQQNLRQHSLSRHKMKRVIAPHAHCRRKLPVTKEMVSEIFDVVDSSERSISTQENFGADIQNGMSGFISCEGVCCTEDFTTEKVDSTYSVDTPTSAKRSSNVEYNFEEDTAPVRECRSQRKQSVFGWRVLDPSTVDLRNTIDFTKSSDGNISFDGHNPVNQKRDSVAVNDDSVRQASSLAGRVVVEGGARCDSHCDEPGVFYGQSSTIRERKSQHSQPETLEEECCQDTRSQPHHSAHVSYRYRADMRNPLRTPVRHHTRHRSWTVEPSNSQRIGSGMAESYSHRASRIGTHLPDELRNVAEENHLHCYSEAEHDHGSAPFDTQSSLHYYSDQDAISGNRPAFRSVRSRGAHPFPPRYRHPYHASPENDRNSMASSSARSSHSSCWVNNGHHETRGSMHNRVTTGSTDEYDTAVAQRSSTSRLESMQSCAQDAEEHALICELGDHLSSLRTECEDSIQRCRKLQSIRKILHRILLEGETCSFMRLKHEMIRYPDILTETPSIIRIFQLSGFRIESKEFVMKFIDRLRTATIVAELDREIQANIIEI